MSKPPIAFRTQDDKMYDRISEIAESNDTSLNMATNMLVGFALNELEKQGKTLTRQPYGVVVQSSDDK